MLRELIRATCATIIATQCDMKKVNKEPVYLRQRKRSNGLIALYLDICRDGKRVNEYLKLYLVPERTKEDRVKNKETLQLAQLDILNKLPPYGLFKLPPIDNL